MSYNVKANQTVPDSWLALYQWGACVVIVTIIAILFWLLWTVYDHTHNCNPSYSGDKIGRIKVWGQWGQKGWDSISNNKSDMIVLKQSFSHKEIISRRIAVWGWPQAKPQDPIWIITKAKIKKGAGDVVQVVEYLQTSERPWVQTPLLTQKKKKKLWYQVSR
jgi:hypothetical protein